MSATEKTRENSKVDEKWQNVPVKRRNNQNNFSPQLGQKKGQYVKENNNNSSYPKNEPKNIPNNNGNSSPSRNVRKPRPGEKMATRQQENKFSRKPANGAAKESGIKINLRTNRDILKEDYEKIQLVKHEVSGFSEEEIYSTLAENDYDVVAVINQLHVQGMTKWNRVVQDSMKGSLPEKPPVYTETEEAVPNVRPQKKNRTATKNTVSTKAPKGKQKTAKNVQNKIKDQPVQDVSEEAADSNNPYVDDSLDNDVEPLDPEQNHENSEDIVPEPEPKKPDVKQEKMKRLQEELRSMAEKKELVRSIQKELETCHLAVLENLRQDKKQLLDQKQNLELQIQELDRQVQTIDTKIENAQADILKFNSLKEQTLQVIDAEQFSVDQKPKME
eukprot:TRINITY_DN753_c0_g1_i1.p1 TRINITY_DN753_c0_g1~~TRINITY_DN753_c0_g1_i1.p1  ORF type:complete len:388 (+),score=112.25 TRINITY_DN753_c0_g1_i1:88-1251(+)